jgi:hypothetical protein
MEKNWTEASASSAKGVTTLSGLSINGSAGKTLTSFAFSQPNRFGDVLGGLFGNNLAPEGTDLKLKGRSEGVVGGFGVDSVLSLGWVSGGNVGGSRMISAVYSVEKGAPHGSGRAMEAGTEKVDYVSHKSVTTFKVEVTEGSQNEFKAKLFSTPEGGKTIQGTTLIDFTKLNPGESAVFAPTGDAKFKLEGNRKELPVLINEKTVGLNGKISQERIAGTILNDGRATFTLGEGGMDFSGHINLGGNKLAIEDVKGGAGGKIDDEESTPPITGKRMGITL